ncbi:MAG: RagB/SusD family nutrient uptake outer membrane protein, partial [Chitinophagaceae bacterium]|nr:RagB/SusD family nutrient uptake outer membrane protein [Chitinophagaceae bacterium]
MIIRKFNSVQWLATFGIILGFASCGKYLTADTKIDAKIPLEQYYQTPDQIYSALASAYSAVRINAGGFYNQIFIMNAGSDECYCGGASPTDGGGVQFVSNYKMNATNIGDNTNGAPNMWYTYYIGIANANALIDNIGTAQGVDDTTRIVAECKALRAYYYFNLVRVWGNVPLFVHPVSAADINSVMQAAIPDVYAQIEQDLTDAIPNLPTTLAASDVGRLSQGAATALLGKVYLYEGDGMPGAKNPDGSAALAGNASKYALAAQTLAKVNGTQNGASFNSSYGYQLLTHFNDLWSNKLTNSSPLFGNSSGRFNSESIFEDVHTNQGLTGWGNWGSGSDMGNTLCTLVGPRGYVVINPGPNNPAPNLSTVGAWSFNPITPGCYSFMKSNMTGTDSRFAVSILDMQALADAGYAQYNPDAGFQNTGYFLNKYMPLVSDQTNLGGDAPLNFQQDTYIIRLADTYLMEAEALLKSSGSAARALALVNAVRNRAGATALSSLTLQKVYDERRLELMGEGHRWFDLVRTGQAATVLAARGFTASKNELFPISYRDM